MLDEKQKKDFEKILGIDEVIAEKPINRFAKPTPKSIKTAPKKLYEDENLITRKLASQVNSYQELKKIVTEFNDLDICKTANNCVFGDGNINADIMLIGEAPGAHEDEQGIPFCGESGKLLTKIFKFINLDRSNYYVTNSVFWRPPGNRRPTPEEIKICRPFLEKHIALIDPKLIILVGGTALSAVLDLVTPMTKARQQLYPYKNQYLSKEIDVCAIFHPSYLLRQGSQKKLMWNDLLFLENYMKENVE